MSTPSPRLVYARLAALVSLAAASALAPAACGGDDAGDDACAKFAYVASGTGKCDEGCSLSCECPDDFPTSVAKCTEDGCIVEADCDEVCAAELKEAVNCTSTYTVK